MSLKSGNVAFLATISSFLYHIILSLTVEMGIKASKSTVYADVEAFLYVNQYAYSALNPTRNSKFIGASNA